MTCLERVALSFGHRSRSIWVGCRLKPDGDVYRFVCCIHEIIGSLCSIDMHFGGEIISMATSVVCSVVRI